MKNINNILLLFFCMLVCSTSVWAGNKDRVGQAGATELLINPWARASGFNGINSATTMGVEAMRLNMGGLAFAKNTEIVFSSTQWLQGSGVNINSFGFGQHIGESGVLGISMMAVTFGELDVTSEVFPDGNSGATFRPLLLNMGVGYAKSFSNSIHVGFLLRVINQNIADAGASGVAFDMGIQYITGPNDNIKFGISLRNVGTPMRYGGDGLSIQLQSPQGYSLTVDQRTDKFELPSVLNIGGAYDIHLAEQHRLTILANFTSNSFGNDYLGGGLEYAFNEMFMVRGAYRNEEGLRGDLADDQRTTAYTGLSVGVTLEVPFKKDGPSLGVDYAYRTSNPFGGTHTIGVKIGL